MHSDLSWRLPLIFQCVPAFIVICCVWFLPESPRWLMANSREDEALAFLARFHGNGDPNHPLVQLEYQEFKDTIAIDGADKRWWDYSELFKTSSARWRSLMVLLMVSTVLSIASNVWLLICKFSRRVSSVNSLAMASVISTLRSTPQSVTTTTCNLYSTFAPPLSPAPVRSRASRCPTGCPVARYSLPVHLEAPSFWQLMAGCRRSGRRCRKATKTSRSARAPLPRTFSSTSSTRSRTPRSRHCTPSNACRPLRVRRVCRCTVSSLTSLVSSTCLPDQSR